MLHQSVYDYPAAASGSDSDIITAAKTRAAFWKYKLDGYWTVTIRIAKRTIEVSHNPDQGFSVRSGGSIRHLNA